MLVPFLLRVFLAALLLLDGLVSFSMKSAMPAQLVLRDPRLPPGQAPFGRGARQFIVRALDHHASVRSLNHSR